MVKKDTINNTKRQIQEIILEQLKEGKQTKIVNQIQGYQDAYCLGQFVRNLDRKQRGIHGSSTGLRVISSSEDTEVISGLVLYLKDRAKIEGNISTEDKISSEKIQRDDKNVIKISETLYSISFLKAAQSATEELTTSLLQKLDDNISNVNNLKGWGYFLDSEDTNPLPTAHAYIALKKNGKNHNDIRESLTKRLEGDVIDDPTKLAINCFILFAITIEDDENYTNEELKRLKKILSSILKSKYCVLDDDYEQNIEYWENSEHDYVRIPWQLFLLSTTSILSQKNFYTKKFQGRLAKILTETSPDGFKYPHSGPNSSTRTNSLLYDNLSIISNNIEKEYYFIYYWLDSIKIFLDKKIVRIFLTVILIFLIGYSYYKIWDSVPNDNKNFIETIGNNIVSTVIYSIFYASIMFTSKKK